MNSQLCMLCGAHTFFTSFFFSPPPPSPNLFIFSLSLSLPLTFTLTPSPTHSVWQHAHAHAHTRIVTNNVFPLLELFFLFTFILSAFVHSFKPMDAVKIPQISITFSVLLCFALPCFKVCASMGKIENPYYMRNNVLHSRASAYVCIVFSFFFFFDHFKRKTVWQTTQSLIVNLCKCVDWIRERWKNVLVAKVCFGVSFILAFSLFVLWFFSLYNDKKKEIR